MSDTLYLNVDVRVKSYMLQRCNTLTSGTPLTATRLLSFRPEYLCKCEENSDSTACAGWTDIITSLERYAILATAEQFVNTTTRVEEDDGKDKDALTYQPLQAFES